MRQAVLRSRMVLVLMAGTSVATLAGHGASQTAANAPGLPVSARTLFGRWVAMPETSQLPNVGDGGCTMAEITLTPTTETRVFPGGHSYASYSRTNTIRYGKRDANSFYLIPVGEGIGPYVEIVDAQHIRPEYPDLCLYRRAG